MMKTRKILSVLTVALTVAAASPAMAAFNCDAKIKALLVYNTGIVNVLHTGRGNYTVVCSLKGTYGDVSAATCATWVSLMESIKKKDGIAHFYYEGTGSCATLPTYGNAPVPTYIGDISTP